MYMHMFAWRGISWCVPERMCAARLINLPAVVDGWKGNQGKLITNNRS